MKRYIPKLIGAGLNVLAMIRPKHASQIAFALFCRPLRVRLTEKHQEFLEAARFRTFTSDGTPVQVYSWGAGPRKVLFLHGWQSHSYRWKQYIDALPKDEFTIYSIDAPGHGLTAGSFLSVPLYAQVIRDLVSELGPFDGVVSHSIGSFSLMYTLYQRPLLPIRKVIVMAAPGEAKDFLETFRSTLGASKTVMGLLRDHFMTLYDVTPDRFSTLRFAKALTVPGLIIHDEEDAEAPFHYSQAIHKNWRRSKLMATRGLGHNLRSPLVVSSVVDYLTAEIVPATDASPVSSQKA